MCSPSACISTHKGCTSGAISLGDHLLLVFDVTSFPHSHQISEIVTPEQALYIVRLIRTLSLCSLVLYVYDFVLTYDREVAFMWGMRFCLGKLLYFTVRYYTLFVLLLINLGLFLPEPSLELCTAWAYFIWFNGITFLSLLDTILCLRLYAMYNKSRAISVVLSIALSTTFLSGIAIAAVIMKKQKGLVLNIDSAVSVHICVYYDDPSLWFKLYWIPELLNELLLFGLASSKAIQCIRTKSWIREPTEDFTMLLVMDSILYFFVTFAVYVACWLVWIIKGQDYLSAPICIPIAIGGAMSQRLLVNIRERHRKRTEMSTSDTRILWEEQNAETHTDKEPRSRNRENSGININGPNEDSEKPVLYRFFILLAFKAEAGSSALESESTG